MSRGKNLQEMESVSTPGQTGGGSGGGTSQSKTAVNANASAPDAPGKSATLVATPGQTGAYEDLGGPTPENSRPDDNSNSYKTPGTTLKQVKDIVNAKASAAQAAETSATSVSTPGQTGGGMKEESEEDAELVEEEEVSEVEDSEDGEETEEGTLDDFIEEDVNALLSDEDLSDEFKEKARLVFEAALHAKTKEIQSALEEQYAAVLAEEIEEIKLELTERVDSYLEYVSSEWLEENALAVEGGLKTEITESFINGMKGLFEDHYVAMPEDRYDVLESMVEKLDEMEEKLNEQISKNVALNNRLSESVAETVLNAVSEGLAVSQKDKLATLAESVEFESETNYYQKLVTLRDSYFSRNTGVVVNETESLTEEASFQGGTQTNSRSMDQYLRALSTVTRK